MVGSDEYKLAKLSRALHGVTGFVAGFVVALMAAVVALVLLLADVLDGAMTLGTPDRVGVRLVTPGEAITRAGGREVTWRGHSRVTQQTCRGACDQLVFEEDRPTSVEVRGEAGQCVLCGPAPFPSGLFAWFGGPAPLDVQLENLQKGHR